MTGISPRIVVKGNRYAAMHLLRFAKVQLNTLKEQLAYRNLFQGTRRYYGADGTEIKVSWTGPQPFIEIFVPPGISDQVRERETFQAECWCTCCFAEAEVLEVLGNYGDWPDNYSYSGDDNHLVQWQPDAIRYRCRVCVSKYVKAVIVCASTDFAQYYAGDPVAVYRRGRWLRSGRLFEMSECFDCVNCITSCLQGYTRRNKAGSGDTGPEGTHVILPLSLTGLTDNFDHGVFATI